MASGDLGRAAPAAETLTTVYTVPNGKVATFNVLAVNRANASVSARVAITRAAVPADEDWVEYDALLSGKGAILERFGLIGGAGEKIIVWADGAAVTWRVNGFEGAQV
ncbi:hypothetical protein AKG11_28075 [Shinella sp. SUS2]|uniref:hypothetical protein n=1 Tax=unclassified Shinella TaxID=2643062 RepID=UPI00068132B1|nr:MULTISPECIES: hypothetical protein [unclassified Shinella]KNY13599.1 hypothetical protein AKG11_28075 [Shinella sp. SUS2]KOC72492.1 hypothetical protein AKG10_26940 [Shinella sp. GWS1]